MRKAIIAMLAILLLNLTAGTAYGKSYIEEKEGIDLAKLVNNNNSKDYNVTANNADQAKPALESDSNPAGSTLLVLALTVVCIVYISKRKNK